MSEASGGRIGMLTEKWLEDTIRKHVAGVLRRTAVEDGVAFSAIGYAAAAIFARLSEGVLWSGRGIVREAYSTELQVAIEYSKKMAISHWASSSIEEMGGEPVEVIVRKVARIVRLE